MINGLAQEVHSVVHNTLMLSPFFAEFTDELHFVKAQMAEITSAFKFRNENRVNKLMIEQGERSELSDAAAPSELCHTSDSYTK